MAHSVCHLIEQLVKFETWFEPNPFLEYPGLAQGLTMAFQLALLKAANPFPTDLLSLANFTKQGLC